MLRQTLAVESPAWEAVVREKERMARAFAPYSSALLLDPIYGAAPLLVRSAVPGTVGILVSCEQSGYESVNEGRVTLLQPGWSISAIKRIGASAVKLLVPYHPAASTAERQEEIVRQIAQECREQDIALLLEPMSYPLKKGQKKSDAEFAAQLPEIVVETARRLVPLGMDVLKAEFPTQPQYEKDEGRMRVACRRLSEVAGVPWGLLSAGVDFATFQRQVEIACEEGASGFLAGRAIWQEGMILPDAAERDHFLATTGVNRLRHLVNIANERATPWTKAMPAQRIPQASKDWHLAYAQAG
jgi:tagatose 1,6-diphosphate aldolase